MDVERLVAVLVDPYEVGRQVVAQRLEARVDEVQAVAPVGDEVVRVLDLLVQRLVAEAQHDAAGRSPLDFGDFLVGHAEQLEDDERGQLIGEAGD